MKPLLTLFLVLLFGIQANAQVVINEVSCANLNTTADNFGEFEDWIELYNTSPFPVNLAGWYLSDNPSNPDKWSFPAVSINGNGRLVVWATGRDVMVGSNIHCSFKLTQTAGETVLLSQSSGLLADQIFLLPTQKGHSYGRASDGATVWMVFPTPTHNAPNAGGKLGYVAKPVMSFSGGAYPASIDVIIHSPNAGNPIHFTTDGTEPTTASTLYTGPVAITTTKVLKAIAISGSPDSLSSFTEFHTYLINENHSVSVISIAGNQIPQLLGGNSGLHPSGSFELFKADGQLMDKAFGEFNKHGNDSWAYQQRGFDFIARDAFGYNHAIHGTVFPQVPRTEFQRLIVKAAANDNYPFQNGGASIRDSYVHSLAQAGSMELDCRSHQSCVVYLNGQYWGVYDIREKVDDHDFTKFYYNQSEFDIDFIKTWGSTWAEYGSNVDWLPLKNFILTNDMSLPANYAYVTEEFNVLSLIDYLIINTQSVCKDWLNWNTAWWRGRNPDGEARKWRYALWDMDATFGHYVNYTGIPDITATANPCDPMELVGSSDPQGHMQLVNKLMENPEFHDLYVNRYADLNNTIFNCSFMIQHFDSLIGIIEPEMPRQILRWGGSLPVWETNVQAVRNFINERCNYIIKGIGDCFDVNGGFTLQVKVEPEGAGFVKLNTITLHEFPWTGLYFGGVTGTLAAFPLDSFSFHHWEFNQANPMPNENASQVSFYFGFPDTVVAHFSQPDIPDTTTQSVYSENLNRLRVFPSLTTDRLSIVPTEKKPFRAELYSATGQLHHSFPIEGPKEISLRQMGLRPGLFLLRFSDESSSRTFRIVLR